MILGDAIHAAHARLRQPLWALIAILAILLGASWLRATHLTTWPPGLSRDQAVNGVDALQIAQTGTFPFYSGDGRPEPMYRFFLAPLIALVGSNLIALRFVSFAFGVLAVAAAYRAARHMVPSSSGRAARIIAGLLAAGTLAILPGHITLSRVAYRAIPLPFGLLLFVDAFVTAWRARRRESFLATGIWLGFCVMSYTAGLAALPIAALGALHQGLMSIIRRPKESPRVSWISGNLWTGRPYSPSQ